MLRATHPRPVAVVLLLLAASLPGQLPPMAPAGGDAHTPAASQPLRVYAEFGIGIGRSNLVVEDSLGLPRIYAGASTEDYWGRDYWYVLRFDPATAAYRHEFVSPLQASSIRRLALARLTPGAQTVLLVALENGDILIHERERNEEVGRIRTWIADLAGLWPVDLDGDGGDELLVTSERDFYVYSGDGTRLVHRSGIGGVDVIAGQMDRDRELEVALSSGRVLDAATWTTECFWPGGFGSDLELSDFDGDGMEELIFADDGRACSAFDVDTCTLKWSITVGLPDVVHAVDLDRDGVEELLVGTEGWGGLTCYDMRTPRPLWSINSGLSGVAGLTTADADGDGELEILWGAGVTSTGSDAFFASDWQTQSHEWESPDLDGPFLGPAQGDVDGDGEPEVVTASTTTESGYQSGRIVVLDADLRVEAISAGVIGFPEVGIVHDVRLHDVDGDPEMEILIALDDSSGGEIHIYDYFLPGIFSRSWTVSTLPTHTPFQVVQAGDVDLDGDLEILGGTGLATRGDALERVYVYDHASGQEEWHSRELEDTGDWIGALEVADTDGDGIPEILAMSFLGRLYVFDGRSHRLEAEIPGRFTSLALTRDGAGLPVILLGDDFGWLAAYGHRGTGYLRLGAWPLATSPVAGVAVGPDLALLLATTGQLRLYPSPQATGPVWESPSYDPLLGRHMIFLPACGRLVTAGRYAVLAFGQP